MIERCVMLFLKVSCIISLVGRNWPTAKNISCSFLSVMVTIHICSWDIPLNLEGLPLWRAFLRFKEEPLEDLRTYVSSHSIVPDSCIFFASKYFSSILRNLERFRRAAVLWIGTNRQGVDTDLYKLIYIDLQKGNYHM